MIIKLIVRRLLSVVPVLLIVALVVLLLLELMPADPAEVIAGDLALPAEVERTREQLGLGRSFGERYVSYVADAAVGDLGESWFTSESVSSKLFRALPVTASVTIVAFGVAVLLAVPTGGAAAVCRGRPFDRVFSTATSALLAVPTFVSGLVLVLVFSLWLELLPATGYVPFGESPWQWLRHLILPGFTVGVVAAATLSRQIRSRMGEVMDEDFVRSARAAGLSERTVIGKRVARNAAAPALTVAGLQVSAMLSGSLIVERIFGLPGFGSVTLDAVFRRDMPVVQGSVLVSSAIVVVVNLLVDISVVYANPKLRTG
ncbi:MAG TPA: ABC transporter permease [Ilumatobacter sp.]|nr:ABC transporter permease [Ilumatobacter sp.]